MKAIGIVVVLAVALAAAGCGDTERLENELASANVQIHTLDSTLSVVRANSMMESAQVYNLTQDNAALMDERDDLQASLASTKARVGRLDAEMRRDRVTYQQATDSLNGVNAALTIDINSLKTELDNAQIHIVAAERRTNDLIRARDSVYAFVDGLRPWYDYYKLEAQRTWLKKLFKAGDAPRPDGTEPSFDTEATSTQLEALKP